MDVAYDRTVTPVLPVPLHSPHLAVPVSEGHDRPQPGRCTGLGAVERAVVVKTHFPNLQRPLCAWKFFAEVGSAR